MTRIVLQFDVDPSVVPLLLEQVGKLDLGPQGRMEVVPENENDAFDPSRKLTYDELFALPQALRFRYFDAHGGVLAVMKEMGFGLTDEQVDDWHKFKAEKDAAWEIEYEQIYGHKIPD